MAQVTVKELADVVGASVDRLLTQMKEAGLPHSSEGDTVSDEEKQTLLAFLKNSHGDTAEAQPKKITLKRKTISTIKSGGKKTVVEVRKKRTFVKREEPVEETVATEEAIAEPVSAPESEVEAPARSELVDDAESKRQAALLAKREEEAASKKAADKKKEKPSENKEESIADKEARLAQEEAKSHHKKHDKHAKHEDGDEEEDVDLDKILDKPKKKAGVKKPQGTKKQSQKDLIAQAEAERLEEDRKRKLKSAGPVLKLKNRHGFKRPTGKIVHDVEVGESIVVSELAQKMAVKSGEVIKRLMKMGEMVTINQSIDHDTAVLIIEEMGHKTVAVSENAVEEQLEQVVKAVEGDMESRAPVVTVMGHVDHGKTSLLDYIRETKVTSGEAGGITQHIGAYRVKTSHGEIAFLDTPGHAAFTAMRARGAQCTDVVILVVAADDGVMPQTEEAVQHARAAGVPIVVAVNKCDKETADPDRVKNELAAKDVIPEDWGGDTQFIHVSALTGQGVEELLEAVSLQAELLELKAARNVPAQGVVVESRMEKGRGAVTTVLIQQGELERGSIILAGQSYGRVRAMTNEFGQQVKEAGPSTPVEILGLDSAPNAGDEFMVVPDERKARDVAEHRAEREREEKLKRQQAVKLENMFANMGSGEKKILPVVVKTDVRGSLEAIQASLLDLGTDEVGVNIIGTGVGGITESDINLAMTSGAIVIGFNVRADGGARKVAEKESVEIRYYSIIYQLIDDVKAALSGMLDPELREEIVGIAEVRDVFRSPKLGAIAGCMVTEGTVYRNKPIRVLRDNVVIYEGELESLRRFKDDVADVRNGMECGIGVKDYNDVKAGDQIEVFDIIKVAREL
ncbi:MAG: translation initiation factor IF-2 [Cellvibrionaceae bacterium]